jgi:outer membrane lipoprotein carrier protein
LNLRAIRQPGQFSLNDPGAGRVYAYVSRFLLLVLATSPVWAATVNISQVLSGVEKRYNSARTLTVEFSETYAMAGRRPKVEIGVLHLQKPGKMRWDYSNPEGKQFVSDGKFFYLYSPGSDRAEKTNVRQSADMHAPLGFLIGRLNFQKDFRKFESRPQGENTWIKATPNSQDLPYSEVEFVVSPDNRILEVKVLGQDKSTMEFAFKNEKLNPRLDARVFEFRAPPGVQVVEAVE